MTTTIEPAQGNPAGERERSYAWIWSILTGIFLLDQATKWLIVHHSGFRLGLYPPFDGKVVIPDWFNIVYAINHGAAWGMLEGYGWVLVLFAFLVLVLIYRFRAELELRRLSGQWCFGLISGGILGNTVDRVFRGHVVDFLDVRLPGYQWPTFNVADSAIVVGIILYIYLQFRPRRTSLSSAD